MTPEVQGRVFEPFFSTKPAGQGLGLGLPVVRSIMLAHQGAAVVESRPQEGTAIHLLFPEHPAAATAPGLPESLPRGSGQRIMLVDDHELYRDATQGLLQSLGYRVVAFASPLEAMAAFRAGADEFDLVLTDLSMREMNGAELARQLLATRPAIPIFLSSGHDLAGVAAQVRNLGVREVLTKPVQRQQLAESLARALAQRPA
jgi:CheY-like chemotaxis protein